MATETTEATCYRHPGRTTRVQCSSCGRPICPDCMTPSPVGMRCPECSRQRTRVVRNPHGQVAGFWANPATFVLIAINVIVYLIEIAGGSGGINNPSGSFVVDYGLYGPFVAEALRHPASSITAAGFVSALQYPPKDATYLMQAVEFDAVLAAGLGRLGLWRDPAPLPGREDAPAGWAYYLRVWAPGMPRPNDWAANWARAWAALG